VTSRTSDLGSSLAVGVIAQLLWMGCCLWSYTVVARNFDYEGFLMAPAIEPMRLAVVIVAVLALSLVLPHRLANPADYVLTALFDISFVPFCSYWALSGQPWWEELLVIAYWSLFLLASRIPMRFRAPRVRGSQNAFFLTADGLVLLGGILIIAGGHLTLKLPLGDVYAVRYLWASEGSGMSMYLFPWLANALLPLLLAHAWKSRRFVELSALALVAYMLYTSTGMKAYLIMPVLLAGVLLIAKWRPSGAFLPAGLTVFAGLMVGLDRITGTLVWTSLGLRRALFLPVRLTTVYLDFFSHNPQTHMSDSLLFRGWMTYPYSTSVAHVIGAYLGQPDMGANNGLVADGFANFGTLGVLAWALLLGLLLQLLVAATESPEQRLEAWAAVTMWPVVLVSSALTTSLLTQGLALGLVGVWALRPFVQQRGALPGTSPGSLLTKLRGEAGTKQRSRGPATPPKSARARELPSRNWWPAEDTGARVESMRGENHER
jgi:hypothetical protein